ncbi:MAG: formylglycine-generating enzyme family protein, partial [Armatimonadota bacterium]
TVLGAKAIDYKLVMTQWPAGYVGVKEFVLSPTAETLITLTSDGTTAADPISGTGPLAALQTVGYRFNFGAGNDDPLDTTPPTTPVVADDGLMTTTPAQLHASWVSTDPESKIADYQYAIGTTPVDPGNGYVVGWTSTGTTADVTSAGLSLSLGQTYYFYIKAKNGDGFWSGIGVSNGIQYASGSTTIADAKLLADGQSVGLPKKAVTYASADFFYIEEAGRNMGIRAEKVAHGLAVGMLADVSGKMATNSASRERYIQASSAEHNGDGEIAPLSMKNSALGGGDSFVVGTTGQRGVTGGVGLNNIGLLVRTWGAYQPVDATTFTIDDGSGPVLCRVAPGTALISLWQKVTITGISSVYNYNSVTYLPMVIARNIRVLLPDNLPAGPEMIYIPAGSFLMGNNGAEPYSYTNEFPQHSVSLSGYWIGKYEVTRGEYRAFLTATGRAVPAYWDAVQNWGTGSFTQTENHPVVGVTYDDAAAYCAWAGGRLPTEAEWEKAARWTGSYPNVYPWGNTWDAEKCNNYYDHNTAGGGYQRYQTSPVGSYPSGASPYGLHDMAGNVWEWVGDWYKSYPGSSSPFDYTNTFRVLRGGSWGSTDHYGRAAYRDFDNPYYYWGSSGFRLAR